MELNKINLSSSPRLIYSRESKISREGILSRDSRDRTLNNTRISDYHSIAQHTINNNLSVEENITKNEFDAEHTKYTSIIENNDILNKNADDNICVE